MRIHSSHWLFALAAGAVFVPALRADNLPYGAVPLTDQSTYALGSLTLNVMFLESNGVVDPDTENWTADQLDKLHQQISTATSFWESQTAGLHPNARLKFTVNYVNGGVPLATPYEPITHTFREYTSWLTPVYYKLGYGGGVLDSAMAFNNDQRIANKTNWAYTIAIVNDQNDPDHAFSDGAIATTLMGGPFSVLTANNGNWGIDRFNRILAHETGHIFYALDEYQGSGKTNTMSSGYLNGINGNAQLDGSRQVVTPPEGTHKLMLDATLDPSSFTKKQVGIVDTDGDGVPDILDSPPKLTGSAESDPASGHFRFTGTTIVTTTPNLGGVGSRNAITINWMEGAEYRLDDGDWTALAADDGAFGGYQEALTLDLANLLAGTHKIDVRSFNSVDLPSNTLSYTFDSLLVPEPGSGALLAAGTMLLARRRPRPRRVA